MASFTRDSQTGRLSFAQVLKDGQGGVDGLYQGWSVTVSPEGKQVYVTAYGDDAVTVFDRDQGTLVTAFR